MRNHAVVCSIATSLMLLTFALSSCSDPPSESTTTAPAPLAPQVVTTNQAPSPPEAPSSRPEINPDTELAGSVKKALEADKEVADQGVDVTSSKGVVSLWGTVGSKQERERAAVTASRVEGVISVENRLVVVKGS